MIWSISLNSFNSQVVSGLLLVPLCVALSVLLGWHIYLILQNKTTIEVSKNTICLPWIIDNQIKDENFLLESFVYSFFFFSVPWRSKSYVACRKRRGYLFTSLWSWCLRKSDDGIQASVSYSSTPYTQMISVSIFLFELRALLLWFFALLH